MLAVRGNRFREVAEKEVSGRVEYFRGKPGAEKLSRKRTFVKKAPEEELYVGAGYRVNRQGV